MAVVERGQQPDVRRQQHAVAEHVARHVADADDRESVLSGCPMPQLAEVALDAFPGAARGDAHRLVVVADAAAGGEGVAEPVAVLRRSPRWRSRRRSPCPCRPRPPGTGRRRRCARTCGGGTTVVPARLSVRSSSAAQVVLVAGDAFLHVGVAVGSAGGAFFSTKPPLRADRHDHRVLHHLRLHQAQHLGAEVLRPVGPAQAAARDLAAAQVDAFEARRVDEDLVQRLGLGQPRHLGPSRT